MADRAEAAIELPTGEGKTLFGGPIAEYRRRVHDERVAYLCATRRLARRTAAEIDAYGIPDVLRSTVPPPGTRRTGTGTRRRAGPSR